MVLELFAWLLELLPLTPVPASFSAAAALSASSLASSAAFSCSAFAWASLRSCWACASASSAVFCSASSWDLACSSSVLFCSSSVCILLSSSISSTLELVIWLVYLQVVMNSPRLCALTRKLTMGLVPFWYLYRSRMAELALAC